MNYVEPEHARNLGGLRLVLTAGVPGPWSQAAKSIFDVKGIPYTPVVQHGGMPNEELVAWTGHRNAPIAVYEQERPRTGWVEILLLAERLAPEPALVPSDPEQRALMFGLSHEICDEQGFGWNRRLTFLHDILARPDASGFERAVAETLGVNYGYSPERGARTNGRVVEVLGLLARQLRAQQAAGSRYLVGERLSAADIYWACFAALIDPLPAAVNPMPDMVRAWYQKKDPVVAAAVDPMLLRHRDHIYQHHLKLPLEF